MNTPDNKTACMFLVNQVKYLNMATLAVLIANIITKGSILGSSFLVGSVMAGYLVIGSITGFVHIGKYDVYRPATRLLSVAQIALFVAGAILSLVGVK